MNPKLEIPVGGSVDITLQFDQPKIGEGPNGTYYLYGVEVMGEKKSYFASDKAHEYLQHYEKGDVVRVEHKALPEGRSVYNVTPVVGIAKKKLTQDDSAEGKVRHGFALEAYRQGKQLSTETIKEINEWVTFVMLGQDEEELPF
jgi:hypothetical protein